LFSSDPDWTSYTNYGIRENATELGVLLAIQIFCLFTFFQKVHGRPERAEMFF